MDRNEQFIGKDRYITGLTLTELRQSLAKAKQACDSSGVNFELDLIDELDRRVISFGPGLEFWRPKDAGIQEYTNFRDEIAKDLKPIFDTYYS